MNIARKVWWATALSSVTLVAGCAASDVGPTEQTGASESASSSIAVRPGRGYDTIRDEAAGDCVDYSEPSVPDDQNGQTVTFTLDMVETQEQLSKKLSVTAGGSMSLGFVNADAKASYLNEVQTDDHTIFLVATATVLNAPRTLTNVRLKQEVKPLLTPTPAGTPDATGLARFQQRCGDGYISAYRTGGTFWGILQIHTSNRTEKEQITASVNASGLMWSASAAFESAVNSRVSNKQVKVWSFQEGGSGATANACTTVDCIITRATTLPTTVAANNAVLRYFELTKYTRLELPSDKVLPIDREITAFDFDAMNKERLSQRDLLSKFLSAQNSPQDYFVAGGTLADGITKVNQNLNSINTAMRNCYVDATHCTLPTEVNVSTRVVLRPFNNPCIHLKDLCAHFDDTFWDAQDACVAAGGDPINPNTCEY